MQKLKHILSVVSIVFAVVAATFFPAGVQAQGGESPTTPTGFPSQYGEGPWSAGAAKRLNAEYTAAIKDCSNPSLECLVHHVASYLFIEMTNSIIYPAGPPDANGVRSIPGGSLNTTSPVADQSTSNRTGGMVGGLLQLTGEMYRYPVAHTGTYVADVLNSAHIATPVQAQGVGFAALDPVLTLWKTFRNVAYLFFVVVFIAIGFMIMLRQKVGGQNYITAQQAIPNVIVSLLFVTFSYAIAGFMIDLMYLSMFMIIGLFPASFLQVTNNGQMTNILDMSIVDLGGALFQQSNIGVLNGVGYDVVSNFLTSLEVSEAINSIVTPVGGITLSLVLAIAILISIFRLFFELLKSYASILTSVITSPIYLMMGALPNNNQFFPWLKDLVANLSAFPTVLLIMVMFQNFTIEGSVARTQGGFLPPFLLGRGQTGAIASLMGLALLLALPEIVKEVKTKLGAREGIGTKIAGWAANRAKQGWEGGELIPGIAATNTARLPLIGGIAGSGKNALKTGGLVAGTAASAGLGAVGSTIVNVGGKGNTTRGLVGGGSWFARNYLKRIDYPYFQNWQKKANDAAAEKKKNGAAKPK